MAYAAVASLSQTIHLILNYHQDSVSPQLKIPITSIHQNVIFLQSFLDDYPDEADNWEERMRDATNEAEDIIEILVSSSLLDSTVGSSEPKSNEGKYEFCSDLNKLERVAEEIESIAQGVKERNRQTAGGFDNGLTEIVDRLCGESCRREIITIVGRGGVGKTTLARNAYNHPLVAERFDIYAWVTVSQDYTRWGGILPFLLNKLRAGGQRNTSLNDQIELMKNFLFFRKYLIVLDDVWNEEVWNMLQPAFPDIGNGSRIILTTRLPDVARSHCHIHEMRSMNVDESWDLLRQKIFKGEPCPPKLEHIGKMIGRSCRGLPLAVEVVAGILSADLTQARWEDIAENMKTILDGEDDDEHPLQILSLTYTYLPHHLRPCLLYLGIFPKAHEIQVSKLIKLWVAEGFLNESECKSLEETGEEYLEELVKRSLVSVIKRRKSDDKVKRVSIHDLIWDLCRRQAKLDNFFLHFTETPVAAGAMQLPRRVSVADIDNMLENVYGSTIRSIICFDGNCEGIPCSLEYFRLLRILDLSEADDLSLYTWNKLHNQIFEQFHLRYLAFAFYYNGTLIDIPKAISKLENLQTLIIRPSLQQTRQLLKLPVEIWRMRQLRHVVVHSCVLPTQKEEEGMFALENLQTLDEAVDLICSRHNLEMMPNLKKLCILYPDSKPPEYYQLYNLIYFQKLEVLKIRTQGGYGISPAFPPTLKRLSLSGLRLPWEDMKIVGLLPHLQELQLRDDACVGSKWETSEGGFSQLNFLLIQNSDLEHWITAAATHFPVLNRLVLLGCPNLRKVPKHIGRIPTLELIEVDKRNIILLASAKSIQGDQQSSRNHSLQVRAVPGSFRVAPFLYMPEGNLDSDLRSFLRTIFYGEVSCASDAWADP